MPFTVNIDPVLLHLGFIEIRYYGLVYASGFLFALLLLDKARREGTLNLTKDELYDNVFYMMLGLVIGARILHVISAGQYYLHNPIEIVELWKGGMAFYGGVAGVLIVASLLARKHGVSTLLTLLDLIAPLAALMLGIGRIANFINAELYGTITTVPWCVYFPGVEGCRHPYQIYSALVFFVIAGVLFWTKKYGTRLQRPTGYLFWLFLLLSSIYRLVLDFWRQEPRLFGLDLAQYISVGAIITLVYVYNTYLKKQRKKQ